jgi:regulator of sigma E protease
MDTFLYVIIALLAFNFVIFFHEAFHYLAAKALKIEAKEFAVGFGKSLVVYQEGKFYFWPSSKDIPYDLNVLSYHLKLLPFGGYVSFDRATIVDGKTVAGQYFNTFHPFKRILVLLAGPIGNLFLGLALFFVFFRQYDNLVPGGSLDFFIEGFKLYGEFIMVNLKDFISLIFHLNLQDMSGPIGTIDALQESVPVWNEFLIMMIGINVALGIANLLFPLSITDGGRIVIDLICWVRRKRSLSTKYLDVVSVLLVLVVLITITIIDIQRLLEKSGLI